MRFRSRSVALRGRGFGGAAAWSPAALSLLTAAPIVHLMRSAGTLWQDSGRTTLAVADGDPVYVFDCTYTGARFTALSSAARMILTDAGGGKWSLTSDGADDGYSSDASAFSGATFLGSRHTQTTDTGGLRVLRSGSVNALIAPRRPGLCVFINDTVINSPIVSDSNPHTVFVQKAAAGNWAVHLDGAAQSVSAVTNEWGTIGLGAGGAGGGGETFAGEWAGGVFGAADYDADTRALIESFLGALL